VTTTIENFMPGSVDVVIVSYRSGALLRECLSSLRRHGKGLNVHVIDNASGDGTAELVAAEFPEARLTLNAANRGFAVASNQGIAAGAAPWVLILNPDAAIREGTVPTLLAALEADPRAAAAGPKLVRANGELDHAAKRSFPTVAGALSYFTRLDRALPAARQYTAPEVEAGPVDAINGAFMLIRRAALDDVGLFDEGYWMYMEDLDLCYRFQTAGWRVLYQPRAIASHLKGGSAGRHRGPRLNAAFHYGMFRFYRKFYAPSRPAPANLAVYAGIAAKLAVSVAANGALALLTRLRGSAPAG
jgi:N-acetylglucosaminyl-diphospho-decaprenol L-rhamnosyltransferase